MVLREVEESAPDTSSPPDSPSSYDTGHDNGTGDSDSGSGRGAVRTWNIDSVKALYAQNPVYPNPFTPIPIYARLLGWTEQNRDEMIVGNANRTQLYIDRPLTPVELQAEAHYHSILHRSLVRSEFIGVISFLGLAAVRQSSTRPGLLTPSINKVMGEKLGVWYIRICRYGVYGFLGRLQGQVIGAMMGANQMKENMKQDPNVRNLAKELIEFRKWSEDEVKRRIKERRQGLSKDQPILPSTEEIRNRHHTRPNSASDADGSPRTLPDAETTEVPYGERDESLGSEKDYISTEASTMPTNRSTYNSSYSTPSQSSNSDASDDIISSLTSAGSSSSPTNSPSPSPSSSSGGSAWDRLRQKASIDRTNGAPPDSAWARSRQQQQQSDPKSDSFTFSTTDEEKAYAKAEAQREFDARVDKERRGAGGDGWATERATSDVENTRGRGGR